LNNIYISKGGLDKSSPYIRKQTGGDKSSPYIRKITSI
jgi:hypothetical protein